MKILFAAALFFSITFSNAQECSEAASKEAQKKLNAEYADPTTSPLTKTDIKTFKALDFYAVDLKYCVTAKIKRTPNEKPFYMATTTGRKAQYAKYGELSFTLNGKAFKLDVFQSTDLMKLEEYKDYLFLPFTDNTNGNGSYAGGRYIDMKMPKGETVQIDFNRSYNPYCAYNHDYSCPIPPSQNFLDTDIKAGVKAYKK
ncbi:DUF1684 domain-containing protein [Flavobacterium sp. Sd200]|uniref:DUF1684 domain-containing protein n=1 Tax=Flavobacterium sp. Sd200 TaxID=2692211 RepID=UPI00136ED124|nr:DUF1684 domain-containing protein [Flavobacterium sp. Sd200]MXN93286.1 DUF1684 domain-containing protein [Flavobacterium sp. Sd200]